MNETMPDVQYMDMFYFRYYFVPWPDCQKFQELDKEVAHQRYVNAHGDVKQEPSPYKVDGRATECDYQLSYQY